MPSKSKPMSVVMLVTNDLARDARVQKEAQALAESGYDVTVVGLGSSVSETLKDCPFRVVLTSFAYKGKPIVPALGRENVFYPVRVFVNKTVGVYRTRKWEKQLAEAEGGYRVAHLEMQSAAESLKPDIIHCHDLDTLWDGYVVAKRTRAKLVYDSHEIFLAMHFLEEKYRREYADIEAKIFPYLDGFVTVSPEVGAYLCEKYQSDIEPLVTYNGGTSIVETARPLDGRVKLFFQGAFACDRNNLELIAAMPELKEYATLTLQGWGEDKEAYEALIKELHLEDSVFVIDPCGPLEVVDSASNYDVGVINSKCIDENFSHTLPNKLFDYMCAGLAVASTDLPPIKKILDAEECGITYEQCGVEHTVEVLKGLVTNPDKIMTMKEASIKAAPLYAWPAQAKKLQEYYRRLETKTGNRK